MAERHDRKMSPARKETDSLGEIAVPAGALYGAQTARAVESFPISGRRMPRQFIAALGMIKSAAAAAHRKAGRLDKTIADAIIALMSGCWMASGACASGSGCVSVVLISSDIIVLPII